MGLFFVPYYYTVLTALLIFYSFITVLFPTLYLLFTFFYFFTNFLQLFKF